MDGETISIDSTHIEARDAYQANQDQIIDTEPTLPPKKRGRKKKCEREAWVLKKQQEEENLPIYEKTIEKQLDIPLETLVSEMPMAPKWGVKKNSKGKNVFWYGYKGHLAVDSQSQYIVKGFLTSGNINDGKLAIPLMKSIFEKIPLLNVKHFLKDAGYDYEPIYRFALNHQTLPVIDYNKRNETQPEGFDKHFRPICKEGYSYVVDSYDAAYKTIKYTKPKECSNCPFSKEMECQKVHKIRVETDIRKYSPLARGSEKRKAKSEKRKELYKKRSSVERVNAYLKEFFQLNNIRHKGGKLANIDFQFSILAYNLSKLGLDSLNRQLQEVAA